jgi:hypothetical protein
MKKYLIVLIVLLIPMASFAQEENLDGRWDGWFMWSPGSPGNNTWTVSGTNWSSSSGVTGDIYDSDPFVVIVIPTGCVPVYLGWSLTDTRMGGNGLCTDGSNIENAWMAAKLGTQDVPAAGDGSEDSP